MNDRRFAVQSFDYDSREEFERFEFSRFRIAPLGKDERPSTILGRCPIDGDSAEVESRVKTNDECFCLNSEAQDFPDELGTRINANMIVPVICSFCFVSFCKLNNDLDFFVIQFAVIIEKNPFLKCDVLALPQFAETPESKR